MINKEEVKHIAKLARLGLKEAEIKKFQKELSSILDYFNSLKEIDVSKVGPTFHPAEHFFERKLSVMREDKAEDRAAEVVNKLIEAAPQKEKRHIKVKTIL
jgi:aspartyl-tRNA(Asn)/glutamyl-tRNA(Gln) amidotransferase subunit C